MKSKIIFLIMLGTLTSCTTHDVYKNTVRDLNSRATKKYGDNNDYTYDLAYGDAKIWKNMTCRDYYEDKVLYNNKNTTIRLVTGPEDIARTLDRCREEMGADECVLIIEKGNCVLDSLKNSSIAMPKEKQFKSNKNSLTDSMNKCINLGFIKGTEKFGECVLKLSD